MVGHYANMSLKVKWCEYLGTVKTFAGNSQTTEVIKKNSKVKCYLSVSSSVLKLCNTWIYFSLSQNQNILPSSILNKQAMLHNNRIPISSE